MQGKVSRKRLRAPGRCFSSTNFAKSRGRGTRDDYLESLAGTSTGTELPTIARLPKGQHHAFNRRSFPHNTTTQSPQSSASMAETLPNPLVSSARASDNSPTVQLHPLVLLTISDCITRHTLRQQTGPVVGAIIGQQNGQEVTMEVAFQAKLRSNDDGDVVLDEEWFNKRIEDCK